MMKSIEYITGNDCTTIIRNFDSTNMYYDKIIKYPFGETDIFVENYEKSLSKYDTLYDFIMCTPEKSRVDYKDLDIFRQMSGREDLSVSVMTLGRFSLPRRVIEEEYIRRCDLLKIFEKIGNNFDTELWGYTEEELNDYATRFDFVYLIANTRNKNFKLREEVIEEWDKFNVLSCYFKGYSDKMLIKTQNTDIQNILSGNTFSGLIKSIKELKVAVPEEIYKTYSELIYQENLKIVHNDFITDLTSLEKIESIVGCLYTLLDT